MPAIYGLAAVTTATATNSETTATTATNSANTESAAYKRVHELL